MKANDSRPVSIYNIQKKELIAVFASPTIAIRYLYDTPSVSNKRSVYQYISRKVKMKSTRFDFDVAIRYANEQQIKMLNGEDYKIMEGYFVPHHTKMKGFTETKETLQSTWNEILVRRIEEQKRKKAIN